MSDYTPDLIHIYSGWWHFIPPGISLIAVLAIALLAVLRRRLFPCIPRWFPVLALSVLIPAILFLLFMAWSRNAWSIHAINHVANGTSQSAIRGEVGQMTGLVLPTDCAVDASIIMGWREYRHRYHPCHAQRHLHTCLPRCGGHQGSPENSNFAAGDLIFTKNTYQLPQ